MPLFPAVGCKQFHLRLSWQLIVVLLCAGIILHLLPFYFMIITTMKSGIESVQTPPTFWPLHPSLSAWTLAFQVVEGNVMQNNFLTYFLNSVIITGGTLLISTPITAFTAYANSKMQRGPLARWTYLFCIGTMFLPGAVSLVPSYLLILHFPYAFPHVDDSWPSIQLFDSALAIIIPSVFNAWGFLFFKSFFDTIPNSILQAARVDGGSELNIFRRIVLPMSIPVFAVVISSQFSAIWDSFLWPSLVFSSDEHLPISVAMYRMINAFQQQGTMNATMVQQQATQASQLAQQGLTWNGVLVLSIFQTIPVFLVFLLSFRYLLRGVRLRGMR